MTELFDTPIRHDTLVRADPDRVYEAMATAEGLDGWFTVGSTTDVRPGGSINFRWQDWGPDKITDEARCPVLAALPGERLVFQWRPDNPEYATTIEVDFEPNEAGTIVRLKEHGYHDTPSGRQACLNCAAGWGEALTLMKFYVEHGVRY